MAEKVTLKMSADAAALIRSDTPKSVKLQAARGEVFLIPADLGNLLLVLSHDSDQDVRGAAVGFLREMPEPLRSAVTAAQGTHPKVIELLAKLKPVPFPFTFTDALPPVDGSSCLGNDAPTQIPQQPERLDEPGEMPVGADGESRDDEVDTVDEESEEFKSKYKLCMELGTSEKIKYALTGDKEWRTILIKDSNKLVSGAVIKNPRITEGEVLTIAKSKIQNDEILRIICMNKDWLKNYQIRKALVENAKTPLPKALRFMTTLTERDISSLAKSKNVSSAISTQARRISMTRK